MMKTKKRVIVKLIKINLKARIPILKKEQKNKICLLAHHNKIKKIKIMIPI